MSLIRKFLFTDESPKLVLDLDKEVRAFGPTYGNRRANGKQFHTQKPARGVACNQDGTSCSIEARC